MIDDVAVDSFWPGYYGGSAGQLLCFDVGDAVKPSLASSVNLSVEQNEDGKAKYANRWNFSEAILNDKGLVYLSSQHTDYVEIEPDEGDEEEDEKPKPEPDPDDPDGPIEKPEPKPIPQPSGYWVTSYELHVVDYTDMFNPVVREPVSIAGTLIGFCTPKAHTGRKSTSGTVTGSTPVLTMGLRRSSLIPLSSPTPGRKRTRLPATARCT
ncbi:MAG: hypothetical protein ACJAX6_001251 [Limisphaerales bacterium]|jgi:hypothetical protein